MNPEWLTNPIVGFFEIRETTISLESRCEERSGRNGSTGSRDQEQGGLQIKDYEELSGESWISDPSKEDIRKEKAGKRKNEGVLGQV